MIEFLKMGTLGVFEFDSFEILLLFFYNEK